MPRECQNPSEDREDPMKLISSRVLLLLALATLGLSACGSPQPSVQDAATPGNGNTPVAAPSAPETAPSTP
jgi:hypothetical protein